MYIGLFCKFLFMFGDSLSFVGSVSMYQFSKVSLLQRVAACCSVLQRVAMG